MSKDIEIGDLVSSLFHVGMGIVLDIVHPEEVNNPASNRRVMAQPMAEVYWVFPKPIQGDDGWENGKDYAYLSQLVVITEKDKDK